MSSALEDSVARWWEQYAATKLDDAGLAQVDIDDLSDDPPELAVAGAVEAVEEALQLANKTHPWVVGLVTVPLAPSASLRTESPRVDDLLLMTWTYGPGHQVPGIYLLKPELLDDEADEEFRVDLPDAGVLPKGFSAYYRCWRTAADAERGWEYNRTVYLRSE